MDSDGRKMDRKFTLGGIMQFTAVIFDLDGVLVHTDHFHYLAWKKIADEKNIEFKLLLLLGGMLLKLLIGILLIDSKL